MKCVKQRTYLTAYRPIYILQPPPPPKKFGGVSGTNLAHDI